MVIRGKAGWGKRLWRRAGLRLGFIAISQSASRLLLEGLARERRRAHRRGIAADFEGGGIFLAPGIVGLARLLARLGLLDGVLDHFVVNAELDDGRCRIGLLALGHEIS